MAVRITFVGAGSLGFTRELVRDVLTFPALADANICLMDIDGERLEMCRQVCQRIITEGKYPATLTATTDRRAALKGADAVLITILAGQLAVWRKDIEIPKKYGVDINVGDTRGPSGIFRFLRTYHPMMEIVHTAEQVCPGAIILNYTNPMAMLCRAMQSESKMNITGLCHSVQGTAHMLAKWIGAASDEISYTCAGINHQAFYTEFKWKGQDAYPLIRKAVKKPAIYNEEQVRNEMFLNLGYYVTESSGHNSEYNAWFRKRPNLIEKYCTHGTGWNPGVHGFIVDFCQQREKSWKAQFLDALNDPKPMDLARGQEYAAHIINAYSGDGTPFKFNGNVRNFGLIDNLPSGCCVEVPVYVDSNGMNAIHVGPLPPQCAALANISAANEEMAVAACETGDPNLVYYACAYDPLTSAVLSLAEIKNMVNEMLQFNKKFLTQFKCHKV
jgi:alpha-galactosidase